MTPNKGPITEVIREAILSREDRNGILFEIENELYVSRHKAKQLFFAYVWHAKESVLQELLDRVD